MIKKEKIFELKIQEDDDVSGIDSISLVDEPAIEVNWVAFKKEVQEDFHIPDGEDETYLGKLLSKGQSEQELLDEGWEIDRIESVKENFATTPNDTSYQDNSFYRVRYKYALNSNIKQSAIIPTTRQFCRELISKNYVWRIEEVENEVNSFGQSAQFWRGGYNCRHEWYRIFYKKSADIINKASINKGKITDGDFPVELSPEWLQPDTVTDKTMANPSPSTIKNLGLSKEKYEKGVAHYTEDGKLWTGETHKDANGRLMTGAVHSSSSVYLYHEDELDIEPNPCWEGYEPIGLKDDGSPNCVPIKEDMQNPDVSGLPAYVDELPKKKKYDNQHFAVIEDEKLKKIVLGPAMIPDQKIFRKDKNGDPYYVFFSADTIKMIAEKYMRNKYTDNNDTMHDGKAIKDVHVLESWIKEDTQDKSSKYGFENLPVGTWFVSMKVNNLKVWEEVKQGKLNGFSVSGFFSEVAAFSKEEMFLYKVAEVLKNIKE